MISDNMEIYKEILSDIGNFSLVIFGFSVSLFTVIYSFIINKREYLKEYSDKIKSGNTDPLFFQKQNNAILYITTMKKLNIFLIISIFISLGIYICSIITKYFVSDKILKEQILHILILLQVKKSIPHKNICIAI